MIYYFDPGRTSFVFIISEVEANQNGGSVRKEEEGERWIQSVRYNSYC